MPRHKTQPGDIAPDYVELSAAESQQMFDQEDTAYPPKADSPQPTSPSMSDDNLPLGQALKRYPKVVGYCLALTVAIVGWGYDLVIVGSITGVDSFKADFGSRLDGDLIIPSMWLSLWLALPPAGAALGSVTGGWQQDKLGRKFSLMMGSVTSALAIAVIFFSYLPPGGANPKRAMFTAGLTLQGFSVGVIKTTAVTYVSENAPTALRGPAMALFPTFTLLGQLIGSIVVYLVNDVEGASGYHAAFASQWGLALAPFVLSCVLPDSPAYLLRRGHEERALRSAQRLYAPRVSPHGVLERVRATMAEERATASHASYAACFRGPNRRRTLIVILAHLMPTLFGLDLLSNAGYFLQMVGMPSSTSLLLMIAGIVAGMLANGAGIWILTRAGRRSMTLVTLAVTGALWGAMGVSGFWRGEGIAWVAGGAMIAIIVVCGMGCWPASYAIMGEASSLQLRAPTEGIGGVAAQSSSIVMAFSLPYIFNRDAADLGAKTGFVYCALCLVALAVAWFVLPEMKGRTMLELDHMFDMRLPTRKFKGWRMEAHEVHEAAPLAETGA